MQRLEVDEDLAGQLIPHVDVRAGTEVVVVRTVIC